MTTPFRPAHRLGLALAVAFAAPRLAAAKSVVERMEFVPGKKDDNAVRARVQLPIVYKP